MTEPSGPIELYCDFTPAEVTPLPPGVPARTKLRGVVTSRGLTVAWLDPRGDVQRVDVLLPQEDTADVTYEGGQAGPYRVARAPGCSSCGSGTLNRWLPFEGISFVQRPPTGVPYGVPPPRNEITSQRYYRP